MTSNKENMQRRIDLDHMVNMSKHKEKMLQNDKLHDKPFKPLKKSRWLEFYEGMEVGEVRLLRDLTQVKIMRGVLYKLGIKGTLKSKKCKETGKMKVWRIDNNEQG